VVFGFDFLKIIEIKVRRSYGFKCYGETALMMEYDMPSQSIYFDM
jgi:hypothetical protein